MPPKSGFSRTRNVDYDDDDAYDDDDYYNDEEEEAGDGTTEDDKEQMRIGTTRVREALGEFEAGITDAQIQEALWHYYYDVGKSVSYLKNKFGGIQVPKEAPKKEKAVSKFDQAANAAGLNVPVNTGKRTHTCSSNVDEPACPVTLSLPPNTMPTHDADDFFWDVPWGNVPPHRLGVITVDTPCGRRGLLGGSSKLAALAAKRRKEREEAQAAMSQSSGDTDVAVAMLDKLSVKGTPAFGLRGSDEAKPRYPVRKRSSSPLPKAPSKEITEEPQASRLAIVVENPAKRAIPSMFASTLCGSIKTPGPTMGEVFPIPYTNCKGFMGTNAFDMPSPDDIVRAAQAKGSGGARR
jgi:elongation factor 1 alpha-like protein